MTDSISFAAERERKLEEEEVVVGGESHSPFQAVYLSPALIKRLNLPRVAECLHQKAQWQGKKAGSKKKGCSEGTDSHLQTIGTGAKVSLGRDVNRSPAPPSLPE